MSNFKKNVINHAIKNFWPKTDENITEEAKGLFKARLLIDSYQII